MSRVTWNLVKNSKGFYIKTYRNAGTALAISAILNVLLGIGIYFSYFNQPDRDFYATNGVTAPVGLAALDAPNTSSTPLLARETTQENDLKVIPQ